MQKSKLPEFGIMEEQVARWVQETPISHFGFRLDSFSRYCPVPFGHNFRSGPCSWFNEISIFIHSIYYLIAHTQRLTPATPAENDQKLSS